MCAGPGMLAYSLQHFGRFAATYMVALSYMLAVAAFCFMPAVAYDKEVADAAKSDKKKDKPKLGFWQVSRLLLNLLMCLCRCAPDHSRS